MLIEHVSCNCTPSQPPTIPREDVSSRDALSAGTNSSPASGKGSNNAFNKATCPLHRAATSKTVHQPYPEQCSRAASTACTAKKEEHQEAQAIKDKILAKVQTQTKKKSEDRSKHLRASLLVKALRLPLFCTPPRSRTCNTAGTDRAQHVYQHKHG